MNEIKCVYYFKVDLFGIIKIHLYILMLKVDGIIEILI